MNKSKWALISSIIVNILPLIITKYLNFIINNIFNINLISISNIIMPIGISFYTFQVITYVVDLYKGKIDRQTNLLLFSLYIMFFPQLIAGPIVKYQEIEKQLINPDVNWNNIKYGFGRFIIGLGKKVLISNQVGFIASSIQNSAMNSISPKMAWLCVIAYTIQILYDFSGYSDMAIGLGSIFGFHFPENFQNPYTSHSITEFWRRWHITLGRFFKEYVYIPLGGNRVNKIRWIINILIVWMLTGLWHGASWNFIIWGMYYGIIIIIEKVSNIHNKLPKLISWIITMIIIMIGWGIFMFDNVSVNEMIIFIKKLLFINNTNINTITIGSLKLWGYIPFLIVGIIISSPLKNKYNKIIKRIKNSNNKLLYLVNDILLILIFFISLIFIIGGSYNPFIYFRF